MVVVRLGFRAVGLGVRGRVRGLQGVFWWVLYEDTAGSVWIPLLNMNVFPQSKKGLAE